MIIPDYQGGSIVNLMASIVQALGGEETLYPALRDLGPASLTTRNIVLLVIDGLGYENLTGNRADGRLAQHLKGRMTSVFPSTTATAVTTFLTGSAPQQHAVTGWFTYFREIGAVLAPLPYRPRHGGSAPKVPAPALFGHTPVFDRIDARSYVVAPERIAHTEFNTAHSGAARIVPFATLEHMFLETAHIVRAPGPRQYVYAYWPDLDRLAHAHGIASPQAMAHFGEVDTAFGNFLDSIQGTETTVIVTADHGFIDAEPREAIDLADHPDFAQTLVLPPCGEQRAAYCYVRTGRRQQFEDYVSTHFAEHVELHESAALIETNYFGLGPPHPRLLERIGDYTLIMKGNATVKAWLSGEERFDHIGVHGSTTAKEMYVPLIVTQG